jgi:hypothetical protein
MGIGGYRRSQSSCGLVARSLLSCTTGCGVTPYTDGNHVNVARSAGVWRSGHNVIQKVGAHPNAELYGTRWVPGIGRDVGRRVPKEEAFMTAATPSVCFSPVAGKKSSATTSTTICPTLRSRQREPLAARDGRMLGLPSRLRSLFPPTACSSSRATSATEGRPTIRACPSTPRRLGSGKPNRPRPPTCNRIALLPCATRRY